MVSSLTGALANPDETPPHGRDTGLFSRADCAIQSAAALAHAGRIYKEEFSTGPNGYIAITGDSAGNAIGLHSNRSLH